MHWEEWSISLFFFQKNTLFKSFIKVQLNYCLLLQMLCSRLSNNLINKIHESVLSLTSEMNDIHFSELLAINNEVSVRNKNMQTLLIELYKNLNGLSLPIMLGLFTTIDIVYNLRYFQELYCEKKENHPLWHWDCHIQGNSVMGIMTLWY